MKFRGEYYFLSNMYPVSINLNFEEKTYTFTCAEAAFQACKNVDEMERFVGIDGFTAKKLGRKVVLRSDWDEIKNEIMYTILQEKFTSIPYSFALYVKPFLLGFSFLIY